MYFCPFFKSFILPSSLFFGKVFRLKISTSIISSIAIMFTRQGAAIFENFKPVLFFFSIVTVEDRKKKKKTAEVEKCSEIFRYTSKWFQTSSSLKLYYHFRIVVGKNYSDLLLPRSNFKNRRPKSGCVLHELDFMKKKVKIKTGKKSIETHMTFLKSRFTCFIL